MTGPVSSRGFVVAMLAVIAGMVGVGLLQQPAARVALALSFAVALGGLIRYELDRRDFVRRNPDWAANVRRNKRRHR